MAKFAAFCEVTNGVLKPGHDFVWIMAGQSDEGNLNSSRQVEHG